MDPRKGKQVASGSRGRGRANRPQPVRVPQNPVYRPMPPSPHDAYYSQPPSYQYNVRHPPMNPYNYIVQQTAEFDPFPTEVQHPQVEEEEIVAETQQPQNAGICILIKNMPEVKGNRYEAIYSFHLGDYGQIVVQGAYITTEDTYLTVTGGTGIFAGAYGHHELNTTILFKPSP